MPSRLAVDHDVIYLTALKPLLSEVATRASQSASRLAALEERRRWRYNYPLLYAVNE
jgi:hypothetical protein